MVSNDFNSSKVNMVKRKGSQRSGTSNLGKAYPNDASCLQHDEKLAASNNEKNGATLFEHFSESQKQMIKTSMEEKTIKMILFILEGERGFANLTPREKMTEAIKRGTKNIQNWFFELGVEEQLPETWETFKKMLIEFCSRNSIESLEKFNEEKWSQYILRLKEWTAFHKYDQKEVFRKLKAVKCPKDLQMLILINENDLDGLLAKIKDWENWIELNSINKNKRDIFTKESNKDASKAIITCYKCHQVGHKSFECNKKERLTDGNINAVNEERVQRENARINGLEYLVLIDSGSSENLIHLNLLKSLKNIKIINLNKPKILNLLNGNKMIIKKQVKLSVEIKGRKNMVLFDIYDNGRTDIILGFELIKNLDSNGKIPIECEITTIDGKKVNWTRPIRGRQLQQEFTEMVRDLELQGIVEESKSTWLNPIVLTRKKNGKLRFCVDLRRLNDITESDNYPLPRIQDLLASLNKMKFFSVIDLENGFFHVSIKETDKEKTAFYCGNRLMQFRKMPQGYKNSPSIFQRCMNMILGELIGRACICYIDDILIFGNTEEEHQDNFNKVLQKLKQYDLKENIDKRIYKQSNVCFLGYNISFNKITPKEDRAQGIVDFKVPKSKKEVQRFLGLVNYDRQFIKNLSDISQVLSELIQKDKIFKWDEKHQKAFDEIKGKFKELLQVTMPDWNKRFILETDASNTGLGAVLRQDSIPIAYASRKLTDIEKKYGITEKEVLASLWGMEKFEFYLIGKEFTLISDHQAIKYIKTKSEFGSMRVQRWFERLERFQFKVEYRKGTELKQADALSRGSTLNSIVMTENKFNSEKKKNDDKILKLHIELNHRKNIFEIIKKEGIKTTQSHIKKIIDGCETCIQRDPITESTSKYIQVLKPGERFGIDLMILKNKKIVILGIDYFSRKLFGRTLKSKRKSGVIKFLNNVFEELKFKTLISDNGKEFNNKEVEEWCEKNNVIHDLGIPYYHKSNGRIERANQTIRRAINKTKGKLKDKMDKIIENYNKLEHRAVGMSPNDAIKENNWNKVREIGNKYKKEFNEKKIKRV